MEANRYLGLPDDCRRWDWVAEVLGAVLKPYTSYNAVASKDLDLGYGAANAGIEINLLTNNPAKMATVKKELESKRRSKHGSIKFNFRLNPNPVPMQLSKIESYSTHA